MATLIEIATEASTDLGLELLSPFRLRMPDGVEIEFDVLIKNFGAPNGMLVTDDHSKVASYFDIIPELGYGCSIFSPHGPTSYYDRQSWMEMLAEWTWTGASESKPKWVDYIGLEQDE